MIAEQTGLSQELLEDFFSSLQISSTDTQSFEHEISQVLPGSNEIESKLKTIYTGLRAVLGEHLETSEFFRANTTDSFGDDASGLLRGGSPLQDLRRGIRDASARK